MGRAYRADLDTGDVVTFVRTIKANDIVVRKGSEEARVRLVGVFAFDPSTLEKNDIAVWATGAADFVSQRVAGRQLRVVLVREELDPRGRHLGFLEADGEDIGRALIETGYGTVYTEYPFDRESDYMAAETQARQSVRGLWGGKAARKRVAALRDTWATVRLREGRGGLADPLLAAGEAF